MRYSSRWALAEKTLAIIDRYNEGATLSDVGSEFGASGATIRQILVDAGVKIRRPGNNRRRHALNENFFEHIDSEEKAYWVGFLLADGCISELKNGNEMFALSLNLAKIDLMHIEKFRKALGSSHKITEVKRDGSFVCRINSTKLCKDLIKLNITPRKTHTAIPAIVPEHLRRHYFRGLIDGDGCIAKHPNALGYSLQLAGTKAVVKDFSTWLGLGGKNVYRIKNTSSLHFGLYTQQLVINSLEKLYDGTNIYLDRKYERYQKAIQRWYSMPNRSAIQDRETNLLRWIDLPKQLRLHF